MMYKYPDYKNHDIPKTGNYEDTERAYPELIIDPVTIHAAPMIVDVDYDGFVLQQWLIEANQ